jgi:hypothetical protein
LARAADWHRTKVSKIEHVRQLPTAEDVRAWCVACSAEDEVAELIAQLQAVDSMYVEYRRTQLAGQRQRQESYFTLDERYTLLRVYEYALIPGIIQTPEYARAIMTRIAAFNGLPDDIEAAVAARMARRRYLDLPTRRFAFVLEEFALYHRIGSVDMMAGQLGHLIAVAAMPNVSLGIVPPDIDRSMWSAGGFWIYDDDRAIVETPTAELTITHRREVDTFSRTFSELSTMAVHGTAARTLIMNAMERLGSH